MPEATFVSPAADATLDGAIQLIRWDLGDIPIEGAWIYVGSTMGGSQYLSRWVGTTTATSVGDLPTDGSAVFARLWYQIDGAWSFIDRRFVAAASPALPFMVEPQPGSTLEGASQTFAWSYGGLEVENGWLYLGSGPGRSEYGAVPTGTTRQAAVAGLPLDESTVHVRLYFRVGGIWYHVDQTYQAASVPAPTRDELIRELQGLVGVGVDGIIGPITLAALNRNWVGRTETFDPSFAARFANDAGVVGWVQRRLNARGQRDLVVDGVFGAESEAAAVADLDRSGVIAAESFVALLDP